MINTILIIIAALCMAAAVFFALRCFTLKQRLNTAEAARREQQESNWFLIAQLRELRVFALATYRYVWGHTYDTQAELARMGVGDNIWAQTIAAEMEEEDMEEVD